MEQREKRKNINKAKSSFFGVGDQKIIKLKTHTNSHYQE